MNRLCGRSFTEPELIIISVANLTVHACNNVFSSLLTLSSSNSVGTSTIKLAYITTTECAISPTSCISIIKLSIK